MKTLPFAPRTLWLVGQYRSGTCPTVVWDFQGIFSTEAAAEDACRSDTYFVMPVQLDMPVPDEPIEGPARYPLAEG